MNIEFEVKFYVDPDNFLLNLKESGAICIKKNRLMKRWVFEKQDQENSWARVRDEGDAVYITYKTFDARRSIDSLQELEVQVDSFETACLLLERLGWSRAKYVENYRETWQLKDMFFMIDTWPWLDTFVEIEAKSEESVKNAIKLLKLDLKDGLYGPTALLYQSRYSVSKKQFNSLKTLVFSEFPVIFES